MKIVYIVICPCNNNDECYHIDSVWTSEQKAQKRCEHLKKTQKKIWKSMALDFSVSNVNGYQNKWR